MNGKAAWQVARAAVDALGRVDGLVVTGPAGTNVNDVARPCPGHKRRADVLRVRRYT